MPRHRGVVRERDVFELALMRARARARPPRARDLPGLTGAERRGRWRSRAAPARSPRGRDPSRGAGTFGDHGVAVARARVWRRSSALATLSSRIITRASGESATAYATLRTPPTGQSRASRILAARSRSASSGIPRRARTTRSSRRSSRRPQSTAPPALPDKRAERRAEDGVRRDLEPERARVGHQSRPAAATPGTGGRDRRSPSPARAPGSRAPPRSSPA